MIARSAARSVAREIPFDVLTSLSGRDLGRKSILARGIEGAIVDEAFAWIEAVIAPAMGMTPMAPFPTDPFGAKS